MVIDEFWREWEDYVKEEDGVKENYEEMKKRHEEEIEELQSSCEHDIGNWTMTLVGGCRFFIMEKRCKICNKLFESREPTNEEFREHQRRMDEVIEEFQEVQDEKSRELEN